MLHRAVMVCLAAIFPCAESVFISRKRSWRTRVCECVSIYTTNGNLCIYETKISQISIVWATWLARNVVLSLSCRSYTQNTCFAPVFSRAILLYSPHQLSAHCSLARVAANDSFACICCVPFALVCAVTAKRSRAGYSNMARAMRR